jgi:hypothetical protein
MGKRAPGPPHHRLRLPLGGPRLNLGFDTEFYTSKARTLLPAIMVARFEQKGWLWSFL